MAFQFSGSYEEAEDMTQDIFFKLYNSLKKFDFRKNFTAWLLTISKNYLIDEYRRTKWEKRSRDNFDEHYLVSEAQASPEEDVLKKESRRTIWEGLNALPSEIRMTIILRDIQGKSYEEIAEIMSLPVGTVKSRINRGRLQLARFLKEKKEKSNEV